MPSEKILAAKQQRVEELVSELKGATTYVFVATRGLTVAQDTEMRSELRKAGVKFEVIKNTVLRRVFAELGFEGLDEVFEGPTAVGYSDDIIAPAKVLAKFSEDFEPMEIKGGIIDGKVATIAEIVALSKVPDPTTLQTQVAYSLLFPFTKLAMLVKAVAEKKQEEGGEAAPAAETAAVEAPAEAPAEEAAPAETPAE
ncbi:MAG: 50S ribosomal protein L10 [Clostridiales bacterium]|jgi:large subunit ribosomal protein L10|nr:50S ribosomal protein L10 [Oscillospiraceae bacterium]MBR0394897.1 50S ribosomal protein L10 [Clostridiales bacterium]MBR2598820.1 50S ribosomal protein L10 [Clostridiales bacterium]